MPRLAALTLIHTFVYNRIDYCSAIYAGLPLRRNGQLECLLHAAARLVSGFSKFDHITHCMCDILQSLSIFWHIEFRIMSGSGGAILGVRFSLLARIFLPYLRFDYQQKSSFFILNLMLPLSALQWHNIVHFQWLSRPPQGITFLLIFMFSE